MANPEITKETLEYLAQLARIKLDETQSEKLLADLKSILGYVSELQSVDTSNIPPMNGGTLLADIFREEEKTRGLNSGAGTEQFSDSKNGFLKIPPVFGGGSQ